MKTGIKIFVGVALISLGSIVVKKVIDSVKEHSESFTDDEPEE